MARRLEFHEKLVEVLGSRSCYFNPPETSKLKYPCIVYSRDNGDSKYANDRMYRYFINYTITIIDRDPDSVIWERIMEAFELCQFERFFVSDELNHWVLRIYY